METNFFKAIAALKLKGDVQITIRHDEGKLIVATLLLNETCGDKARKLIPPAILNGTPEDLDEGYFTNTSAPLQTTSQLFVNMEEYLKAQEVAQQHSKMEKHSAATATKAEDEKTKKYQAAIKKPEQLASEGKFREAWAKYPDPLDHPEHADIIRKRKTELSSKFAPDLFASAATKSDDNKDSSIESPVSPPETDHFQIDSYNEDDTDSDELEPEETDNY